MVGVSHYGTKSNERVHLAMIGELDLQYKMDTDNQTTPVPYLQVLGHLEELEKEYRKRMDAPSASSSSKRLQPLKSRKISRAVSQVLSNSKVGEK